MTELKAGEVIPQSVARRALGLPSNRPMYNWSDVWSQFHAGVRWYLADQIRGMGGEVESVVTTKPDLPFAELMGRKEVEKLLGLSYTTVWQLARDGALATVRYTDFSYKQFFIRGDVERWKSSQSETSNSG